MIGSAYFVLPARRQTKVEKPKPYAPQLDYLKRYLDITWESIALDLNEMGPIDPRGKPVTKSRLMGWLSGEVNIKPWLRNGLIAAYQSKGIPKNWFDVPVETLTKNYPLARINGDAETSTKLSDISGEEASELSLFFLGDDAKMHEILGTGTVTKIKVPEWLRKPNFYAVMVDTDQFYPLVNRGDLLVIRSNESLRADKMSLVSMKSDGRTILVTSRRKGNTTCLEPAQGDDFSSSLAHNDGLVVAILPNYVEGEMRACIDFSGMPRPR